MSIDISIRQKGLIKKPLPLSVITGGKLSYGTFDGVRLEPGRADAGEIVVYDEAHLSRGISVVWNEREKNTVTLRVLNPTSRAEINDAFDLVARIAGRWKCYLEVDGMPQTLSEFMARREEFLTFNERIIKDFSAKVLAGDGPMTLFCTMCPVLVFGEAEAQRFQDSPEAFYDWMHERQSIDAYYAVPSFYRVDGEILGRYVHTEGVYSIFPRQPSVPFGITDPETGRALECSNYEVCFYSLTKETMLGSVPYDDFIALILSRAKRFDADHLLFDGLSLTEMEQVLQ